MKMGKWTLTKLIEDYHQLLAENEALRIDNLKGLIKLAKFAKEGKKGINWDRIITAWEFELKEEIKNGK